MSYGSERSMSRRFNSNKQNTRKMSRLRKGELDGEQLRDPLGLPWPLPELCSQR